MLTEILIEKDLFLSIDKKHDTAQKRISFAAKNQLFFSMLLFNQEQNMILEQKLFIDQ